MGESQSVLFHSDLAPYLKYLHDLTSHIDIRGLQVGSGEAMRFPIEELYIPLTTALPGKPKAREGMDAPEADALLQKEERHVELHEALRERRLVIVGDPGAGKTTFLRRITNQLCRSRLEGDPESIRRSLGLEEAAFPILVRLAEFQ